VASVDTTTLKQERIGFLYLLLQSALRTVQKFLFKRGRGIIPLLLEEDLLLLVFIGAFLVLKLVQFTPDFQVLPDISVLQ
jgi:hypothetical protein